MKRIQEKVKDIIEVRKLLNLQDFSGDPVQILAGYHFTDATSELMAKWLDRVAALQNGEGAASALAGYRGVGKSHFIAAFGALVAIPELRTKVSDSHVAAGAQGLLRRRYPVVYVRRGTQERLIDEVRHGIAAAFEVDVESIPEKVMDLLTTARVRSGDIPFLILIDTAMERGARVSRDDGPLLAEIADAAKDMNAFVAVALDDDISGADGTNSAIVRSFTIDYLDQDHLYKVVDSFVFPKNNQFRPVLHDIYEYFREVMPSFRWSEQKFSALYPLHPVILEVAPFVRLFVHDFALLGFASEAGERILGRPANSLIALDEVFDSAEKGLRKIDDLKEAFDAYDRLNSDVVAKIPVMQRLQAKLILKALLLLSLDGQGTTAAEITAGMLIFDEKDTQKAAKTVEELIRTFAAALPEDVRVNADEGREIKYSLKVSSKDKLNNALDEEAAKLDKNIVEALLHRLFHERFSDSTFFSFDGTHRDSMECHLTWRGGMRRGRVNWNPSEVDVLSAPNADGDLHDWEVAIDLFNRSAAVEQPINDIPKVLWRPAELRRDEIDTLLRFHVLNTNSGLRIEFGDQIRLSQHSHAVQAQRITNRIFLEDGLLVIDNFDYNFTEDARSAAAFTDLFTTMLEPLFEVRYPKHPYFLKRLGVGEVGSLVTDLYSGSRHQLSEVQQLAQMFGLPLGIVKLSDGLYTSETAERLSEIPAVATIQELVDSGKDGASLRSVYAELKKPPFGYVREAQQLIMAAMVSQRMIEFVTSKGDRINQRSLDLKIIWDDIVGLARPQETSISSKKLIRWAEAFSGGAEFKSFENATHCKNLTAAISEWLANWDKARTMDRFNEIPAEAINARIFKNASRVSNTLGLTVAAFRLCLEEVISLEDCFGRVSEAFLDDTANLEKAKGELKIVDGFVRGYHEVVTVRLYLSLAELTGNDEIETCRESLLVLLDEFESLPTEARAREIGYLWAKFQRSFSEYFVAAHDGIMRSHQLQAHADEIRRSDDWWEFENLASFRELAGAEAERVFKLKGFVDELNCSTDLSNRLKTRPFCECKFSLLRRKEWERLTADLEYALNSSVNAIKAAISERAAEIVPAIEYYTADCKGQDDASSIGELTKSIKTGAFTGRISGFQIGVLRAAMRTIDSTVQTGLVDQIADEIDSAWTSESNQSQHDQPIPENAVTIA